MRAVKTLFWVLITAILVAFMAMNWEKVPVNIWPQNIGYFHFEWPVGVVAFVFFLLGLTPMWLFHKATRWGLRRKLDNAERALAAAVPVTYPTAVAPSPTPLAADDSELRPVSKPGDL